MTEFVLVSCSKSKLAGTHRGEDLYEPSDIFGKRRTFAEREGVHWGILSAKHGYLRSWEAVEDYERHISDRTPVWGAFVFDDLLADLEFFDVDQVTVLAGKRYVDPLVPELEARGYDVLDYNRGLRPGERKRALKEANAPGEQKTLVTDGGEDDNRRSQSKDRLTHRISRGCSAVLATPSILASNGDLGPRLRVGVCYMGSHVRVPSPNVCA